MDVISSNNWTAYFPWRALAKTVKTAWMVRREIRLGGMRCKICRAISHDGNDNAVPSSWLFWWWWWWWWWCPQAAMAALNVAPEDESSGAKDNNSIACWYCPHLPNTEIATCLQASVEPYCNIVWTTSGRLARPTTYKSHHQRSKQGSCCHDKSKLVMTTSNVPWICYDDPMTRARW